ncbi:TAO [Mytilus edulis]|uniref:TAO n=1 Tax=Mytilus edulis TaxID=6550 RepID=A0A8S3VI86_MYTED|nr:TAO [Mytilus edulis]
MDILNKQNARIVHLERKYVTVIKELKLLKDENKNLTHQLDIKKTVLQKLQYKVCKEKKSIKNDINLLKATDQARSQDFIALNTVVQSTSHKLHNVSTMLESNLQNVMIRAIGARKDSSYIIQFSDIKESYGISNTTNFILSGKFTCDDAGLYILMIIVFADPSGADVNLYKMQ